MKVLGFSDPLVPSVRDGSKTVTRRGPIAAKRHRAGQVCAVGESIVCASDGRHLVYRSDGHALKDRAWTWQVPTIAGTYMPAWAARAHILILDVRVETIDRVTSVDAMLEGARLWPGGWSLHRAPTPEQTHSTPRAAFFGYWLEMHRGLPDMDAPVARIEFRLATTDEVAKATGGAT